MKTMLPLMLVPLLVWIAVWGYLWTLDQKVKRLERDFRQPHNVEEDDQ